MLDRVDQRLNAIYEALDGIRSAEAQGDAPSALRTLATGLADSCVLLKDAEHDVTLSNVTIDPDSIRILKELDRRGELDRFLDLERRLLGYTKLAPAAIEDLVSDLRGVAKSADATFADWRHALGEMRRTVCAEADRTGFLIRRTRLLKAAYLAGGGVMVTLVNQVGFPGMPMDPHIAAISTLLGGGAITQAWKMALGPGASS